MFYVLTFQHSFLPTDTNSWNYITLVLKKWKPECLVTELAAREEEEEKKKTVAYSSKLQKNWYYYVS